MAEQDGFTKQELDPAFAERDRCRKEGKAVEIARTRRLLIRETTMEDVPKLYEIQKLPEMETYLEMLQPTLEEEQVFMKAYIRHAYAFYDFGLWTILEKESGEIVGKAGLFPTKLPEEGVELGYLIRPDCQRRGYAVECGEAILAYASEVLDITRLHVLADCRNLASVSTARKLGFKDQERIWKDETEYLHLIWRRT